MASGRKRDYKAEYARTKAHAKAAGYKSEREYRDVRKSLKLPARTEPISRKVLPSGRVEKARSEARHRRQGTKWSEGHSRTKWSEYTAKSDPDLYYEAFVNLEGKTSREIWEAVDEYILDYYDGEYPEDYVPYAEK